MRDDYLAHHGIKGQKWGVRRFQNKDGSLTAEGRKQRLEKNRTRRLVQTKSAVDSIISTLSRDEKDKLALDPNLPDPYLSTEQGKYLIKRVLKSDAGKVPVSFFDMLDDGDSVNVVLATRSGDKYRGKGYATRSAREGLKWYEKNKHRFEHTRIVWGVRTDNKSSISVAKKVGFIEDPESYSDDGKWVNYVRKIER